MTAQAVDLVNAVERKRRFVVALVGNPNAGKTTIFNALTGLRQKVGNYPGVTVEKRTGEVSLDDSVVARVVDLPGTYSLVTVSPDEAVVSETLRGTHHDLDVPDAIVAVVDANNLARNLFLVSQLLDLRRPLIVALNMTDLAERHGRPVNVAALSKSLGCAVIPLVGHRGDGLAELRAALSTAQPAPPVEYDVPTAMANEEYRLAQSLAASIGPDLGTLRSVARRLLSNDTSADLQTLRAQFSNDLEAASRRLHAIGIDPMQADIEGRYRWIDSVVARAVTIDSGQVGTRTPTQRVDAVLMHRFFGLVAFAAIMTALFSCVFWLAKPLMDAVKEGVAALALLVASQLHDGPLKALIVDGVFAGVGAVLVFVPQIALLFAFLGALEDSGYLARAAFLVDRLLARVGLHGKSFIPLLSSFACAIPGILATRTIESRRDRLATILVAPFMSCSARLPVYALLVPACFPQATAFTQALVLMGLYLLGIVAAVLTSILLRRGPLRGEPGSFILELPTYKAPQLSQLARQVWTNTWAFVTRAGTTIFALSIVLWALLYYPRFSDAESATYADDQARQAAQIEHSFAGRAGHAIEPIVKPLGYDWKIGVGLVSAFAAREVFVSTLGITYSIADTGKTTSDLSQAMNEDRRADGSPVWTPLVAASLLLWFVLAMQCMSTMAVVRRETGSWAWPLAQLGMMNGIAYISCLLLYQIGSRWFGA